MVNTLIASVYPTQKYKKILSLTKKSHHFLLHYADEFISILPRRNTDRLLSIYH